VPSLLNTEPAQVWKHLSLANLITGVDTAAQAPAQGKSNPATPIGFMFFVTYVDQNQSEYIMDIHQHMLMIKPNFVVGPGSWSSSLDRVISPAKAAVIDRKYDDNNAFQGDIQTISASGTNGCGFQNTTGAASNGPTGYNETNKRSTCELYFKLVK
jgi:hypothetical protein